MSINFNTRQRQPRGLLAQLLTAIVGVLALGAALMFSLVFFAVLAVVGLVFWAYFWWKTRAVRKQIREQMANREFTPAAPQSAASDDVIEGEAVRVVDERNRLSE